MAELPKYRPLGVTIQPLPGVDFAAAGRAKASVFNEISRGLDVMSQYAYEQQKFQAAAEGARYGAENAPTQAQLDEAKKEGADISAMLPGDDYTVFGRSARKTSLDVIIDQSEMEARKSIMELRLQAEQTNMPAAELSAKLNGLISGYSSNLYQLNPAAGSKFQAAMSTVGNSTLLAHAQSMAKEAEKRQEVAALASMDTIINELLPQEFKAGPTINEQTGEITTVDDRAQFLRNQIYKDAYYIGDKALADSQIKLFDKKYFEYKTTYLSDWALENTRNMREIRSGVIADFKADQIWKSLSEPEQMAVRDAIRKTEVANNSLITSRESINQLARDNRVRELTPEINAGLRSGVDVSALIDEMQRLDPDRAEQMIAVRDTKGGVDDADTMQELNLLTSNGQLTQQDVLDAILDKKITVGTADTYFRRIATGQDEREKRAMRILSNAYNGVDLTQKGRALEKEEQKLATELSEHIMYIDIQKVKDPNFDVFDYVVQVSKERKSSAGQTVQRDDLMLDINTQLETYPTLKDLTDIDLMIGEAQRLLNEPYVEGGFFTKATGLSHRRRLVLQDALKKMQKVKRLGAGQ
jgi:hypothetical protein